MSWYDEEKCLAVQALEANVDRKYLTAGDYQTSLANCRDGLYAGYEKCPVHGRGAARREEKAMPDSTCSRCGAQMEYDYLGPDYNDPVGGEAWGYICECGHEPAAVLPGEREEPKP